MYSKMEIESGYFHQNKKVSFTNKGIEFLSQTPNFNSYIFATKYRRLLIFRTINYVR